MTAAAVAASVVFAPALAQAADAPAPAAGAHVVQTAPKDKISSPAFTKYESPASASQHSQAAPGAKSAQQGADAPAANSGLAVGIAAVGTSAYGIELTTVVISDPVAVAVTVNWGDGTSDNFNAFGQSTDTGRKHTYAKLGSYTISVTASDGSGYFATNTVTMATPGSAYTPYGPTRLLDTRDGTGAPAAKVQPSTSARVKVGGNAGIPVGVTAVALNVTVTNTTTPGHIKAFAEGAALPETSNVNFAPGQTVPNLVIVPVGANGYVDLYNGGWAPVDLLADVAGYFTHSAAAGYTAVGPTRLVDTRDGTGTAQGKVNAVSTISTQVWGTAGVPSGAKAVALNVTVTNPQETGHLTVFPGSQPAPTASNVNFRTGQTVANSVIVPVGADGRIQIRNGAWAPTDVIVDVVGYYSDNSKSAFLPVTPLRLLDTRRVEDIGGPLDRRNYVYMPLAVDEPQFTGFVLNATVTNTQDSGHLTVAPDPNSMTQYNSGTDVRPTKPPTSSLNWQAGETVPNLVQANPGVNGIVDFWNASDGDIDLLVDMFGVYQNN
ncbi:hypothetical protein ACIGZJ_08855 [Kitasatospora sp. NPDC052868]|uniref:hypothetical protein n=1 Tax=Kitasatospora sp. NPDC052868 TaxID=3364060 RepID=UPI0037CC8F67